jgi:hypothetical protein
MFPTEKFAAIVTPEGEALFSNTAKMAFHLRPSFSRSVLNLVIDRNKEYALGIPTIQIENSKTHPGFGN